MPLVSCIMPTRDRRRFVPRAIGCFLGQDYPERELVIVDDGVDSIADLVPADPRIKYFRLDSAPLTVGAKRNLAIQRASGTLIAHWDDDDWSAASRLRRQVQPLLEGSAEVSGLRRMLFVDDSSGAVWLYEYPASEQRHWLIGGSLVYRRAFWENTPFAAIQVGEDTRFLLGRTAPRLVEVSDLNLYVATIHARNTSAKNTAGPYWVRWSGDLSQIPGYAAINGDAPATHVMGVQQMKLNIGCCDALLNGYVNVDVVPGPGVECVDLSRTWPWANDSVEHVRAWDIVEHLPDKIFTMNELWRVLAPGGTVEIAVPTTDGPGAFQDPTHVSFWNRRSFLYYEAGNPYRERFAAHYGISARFRTLNERTDASMDGPRLTIVLQAIKT